MANTSTFVTPEAFGAVGDGITSDTAAFTAAFTSLGVKGGSVFLNPSHQYYVSGLSVPESCNIVGQYSGGFIGDDGSPTVQGQRGPQFDRLGSLLWVDSGSGIQLAGNAGIENCVLLRTTGGVHMGFPVSAQSQQPNGGGATATQNLVSSFAGTAVTGNGSDTYMRNCMVIGFAAAYKTINVRRSLADHVYFDCISGIEFDQANDVCYIRHCHAWPYSICQAFSVLEYCRYAHDQSGNRTGPGPYPNAMMADSWRSGAAFKFGNGGDWSSMVDNFSFGYQWGYIVSSCNSNTLLACRADNDSAQESGIGFQIDGSSTDVRLAECQAAGQQYAGVYVATNAGLTTCISDSHFWGPGGSIPAINGVAIGGGNVKLSGGLIRNVTNAVNYASASSIVDIEDVTFGVGLTTSIQVSTAPGSAGELVVRPTGSSALVSVMPSQGTVALPLTGDVVRVTSSSNVHISNFTGAWPGRRVTLIVEAAGSMDPTVSGSNLKTKTNAAVNFGAYTTFQFVWDSAIGYWLQV